MSQSLQIREKSGFTSEQHVAERAPIDRLPDEILRHIFSFNHVKEVSRLGEVCKRWFVVITDDNNNLWAILVERFLPHLSNQAKEANNYKDIFIAHAKTLPLRFEQQRYRNQIISGPIQRGDFGVMYDFDDVFIGRMFHEKLLLVTSDCMRLGRYPEEKSYEFCVGDLYVIKEDNIYIKKVKEREIIALDANLNKLNFSLTEDSDAVSIHREGKYLVFGTRDGSVKIVDLADKQTLKTVKLHERLTIRLYVKDNKIYSVGADKPHVICISGLFNDETARLEWDTNKLVRAIAIAEGKIFVSIQTRASACDTIEIFDQTTREHLATISTELSSVERMYIEGNILIAATRLLAKTGSGSTAHVFNHKTGKQLAKIDAPFVGAENGMVYVVEDGCIAARDFNPPVDYRLKSKEFGQVLAQLGIKSEQDYDEKLHAKPSFLEKVGIATTEDFRCLGSLMTQHQLESLKVNAVSVLPENTLQGLKQQEDQLHAFMTQARRVLDTLFSRVQYSSDVYTQHVDRQGKLLGNRPSWKKLHEDLSTYKTYLDTLSRKDLFTNAAKISNSIAAFIERFKKVDEELQADIEIQRALLSTYLNQPGLLKAWSRLNAEGIHTLADLVQSMHKPKDLFHMGE